MNPNQFNPDSQPTVTAGQPRQRQRLWHQDPVIRTWLLPPVVCAGLGAVFSVGQFVVGFVLSLFVNSVDAPTVGTLVFDLFDYVYWGFLVGLVISSLVQFWKLPQKQQAMVLKALWQGICVLTLLFLTLMTFGVLGGLLGSQFSRKQ